MTAEWKPTLSQQLAEVRREIAMRRSVYPGLVARRKLKQRDADYQIACMEAVERTLAELVDERRTYDDART